MGFDAARLEARAVRIFFDDEVVSVALEAVDRASCSNRIREGGAPLVRAAIRGHDHRPRKTEVRIYDYVDRGVAMLRRVHEKRLVAYRGIGYVRSTPPAPEARARDVERAAGSRPSEIIEGADG